MSGLGFTKEEARESLCHDEPYTMTRIQDYVWNSGQQTQALFQGPARQTVLPFPGRSMQLDIFDPERNAQVINGHE